MKEVNLESILDKIHDDNYRASYKTWYSKLCILDAMKEACRQALELAAENGKSYRYVGMYGETEPTFIDKQSILDLINQIK